MHFPFYHVTHNLFILNICNIHLLHNITLSTTLVSINCNVYFAFC